MVDCDNFCVTIMIGYDNYCGEAIMVGHDSFYSGGGDHGRSWHNYYCGVMSLQ